MKGISAAILLISMILANPAAAAIRCHDAAGHEQGAHWSWREIDGKRCWFLRTGDAMPPKSAFIWAKEESAKQDAPIAVEKTTTGPRIQILKVKAEEISEVGANWLDDAPVDLIVGEDLTTDFGVGGSWVVPPYAASAGETSTLAARLAPRDRPASK